MEIDKRIKKNSKELIEVEEDDPTYSEEQRRL